MRVDAHDRRVAAGADRAVEADRDVGGGVVDEHDAVVRRGELARELGRAVGGGAEGEDQLGRAGDILRQHGLDRASEVVALVEHRHDEAHAGAGGSDRSVLAPVVRRHARVDHVTRRRWVG